MVLCGKNLKAWIFSVQGAISFNTPRPVAPRYLVQIQIQESGEKDMTKRWFKTLLYVVLGSTALFAVIVAVFYPHGLAARFKITSLTPLWVGMALTALALLLWRFRRQAVDGFWKGWGDAHNAVRGLRSSDLQITKFSRNRLEVEVELATARGNREGATGTARSIFDAQVQSLKRELASMKPAPAARPAAKVVRDAVIVAAELATARAERKRHPVGSEKFKELDGRVQRRKAELAKFQQKK